MLKKVLLVAALAALVPRMAAAVPFFENADFEDDTVSGNFDTPRAGAGALSDWTVDGHSVDLIGPYWESANGDQSLDLSGISNGSVSQTVSGFSSGHDYTLFFDIAGNPDGGDTTKSLKLTIDGASEVVQFDFEADDNSKQDMGWVREEI
jgi:hypothetical protein